MVDLLGERERGKAKEIQHKSDRSRREREGTARARLVQSKSCRFGFVQQVGRSLVAPSRTRQRSCSNPFLASKACQSFRCSFQSTASASRWSSHEKERLRNPWVGRGRRLNLGVPP